MNTTVLVIIAIASLITTYTTMQFSKKDSVEPSISSKFADQNSVTIAPYGSWKSPLTAASIFETSDGVSDLSIENDALYFIQRSASDKGRNILVKLNKNNTLDQITSSDLSVRSRVHEYGGKAYLVDGENIYYSRFSDQKMYRLASDSRPTNTKSRAESEALTKAGLRYMECISDSARNQLICVREDHRNAGEPVNTLVLIDLSSNNEEEILFEGTDFVRSPTISPDGNSVAFITWSHPNMPWDDTQLRILTRRTNNTDGNDAQESSISEVTQNGNVAISSPSYSSDGTLYFLADFSNWRTLYRLNTNNKPEVVVPQRIEVLSYDFESPAASSAKSPASSAIISYLDDSVTHISRVNLTTGETTNIGDSFSLINSIVSASDATYFIGSRPESSGAIYKLSGNTYTEIYRPKGIQIASEYLSAPEAIRFPTGNNKGSEEEAYGFFYPPRNTDFEGPKGSLPPLIVNVHGGPVSAASSTLNPDIQFWTSRGFAVFDVNHRGSTGYGREFRKKLYPNWGIVDIEDAANGVRWLSGQGLIDLNKTAIRGGSAGGYTTLAALAFQDVFKAGTSYYGISDLEILAQDTHKFESRFLDQLIGPYPEMKHVYLERSPIYSVSQITAPLLLLQGLDDEVVPPNQSEMIFEALKENCIATAYLTFEGEGHGFRQPANNIKALNSELDFYGQIFGFNPAGNIESVQLEQCGSNNLMIKHKKND